MRPDRRSFSLGLLRAAAGLSAAGLGAACGSAAERKPTVAPAADAPSTWELVYEREVDGTTDLFLIPAGGGNERRLTEHPATDGLARWTPDGRRILFTSDRTGLPQLWEVPAGGGTPRRVRENGASESQHDVSPDGRQIVFISDLDGPPRLLVQDLGTGGVSELVRHGDNTIFGNPHWSPDGRFVTYSSNKRIGHQIYLIEAATKEERRLSGVGSGGCEPRFSRDGRKVVYVSRGHLRSASRLLEHDLSTEQETALVSWPAMNYDPVYSPDGTELAFASNITGQYVIYRQRLSDGQAWRVTFGPGGARYPDYRPVTR